MCECDADERRKYTTIARDIMWASSDILNLMTQYREREIALPAENIKANITHTISQLNRLHTYMEDVESR